MIDAISLFLSLNRRAALTLCCCSALIACPPREDQPANTNGPRPSTPNILWIVADDLGLELGAYGYSPVRTPNIDQLAKRGTLFTHFFANNPVCSPSRSSIITGVYATQINSQHHRTVAMDSLPEPIQVLPELMRTAGYYVFHQDYRDENQVGKTDYNFLTDFKYDGTTWAGRKEGQPFFGQVQILYPHRPFHEDAEHPVSVDQVNLPPIYPDIPLLRADWALYLESVQLLDKEVGKVIDKLKEAGVYDNTVVFFFGDHGRPHLFDKQFVYEGGLRTPLMIAGPGIDTTQVNDLVSGIDLAVATLRLARAPVPAYMPGHDFISGNYDTLVYAQRDRTGDVFDRVRAIRDNRFQYIYNFNPQIPRSEKSSYKRGRYPAYAAMHEMNRQGTLTAVQARYFERTKPQEELYDIIHDPYETHNLIDDPTFRKVGERMRRTFWKYQSAYDTASYPEDSLSEAQAVRTSQRYGNQILAQFGLDSTATDAELLNYWEQTLSAKENFR